MSQVRDELRLQTWLAKAEWRNPSFHHAHIHEEVSSLAQLRDELRLQLKLGSMEAHDRWTEMERGWMRLKDLTATAAATSSEEIGGVLEMLRTGYAELREH